MGIYGNVLFPYMGNWALPIRGGGGVKACQDGLGHFFSTLPRGVRVCQDGLGHFFFHVCPFDRGGGGSKAFWQCPFIESTHFKKGLP